MTIRDWHTVQEEIRVLYVDQRQPLEEVMRLVTEKHKFTASYVKVNGFCRHMYL